MPVGIVAMAVAGVVSRWRIDRSWAGDDDGAVAVAASGVVAYMVIGEVAACQGDCNYCQCDCRN